MWQHHYVIHLMRMEALRAEADRERRWRLLDESNGRPGAGGGSGAGRVRAVMARVVATVSMASARFARGSTDAWPSTSARIASSATRGSRPPAPASGDPGARRAGEPGRRAGDGHPPVGHRHQGPTTWARCRPRVPLRVAQAGTCLSAEGQEPKAPGRPMRRMALESPTPVW